MNILIPDSWLREYLDAKATPAQIKEFLSLCGPSVERIHKVSNETIYDVEVTTNRPDSMSVVGVAREAAAILPRFGIKAKLVNDPYSTVILANEVRPGSADSGQARMTKLSISNSKRLNIITDPKLNPRWTSVVLDNVKVGPSPKWLQKKLELTGIRSLNNIIDITNYLMRSFGQPAHAFDYNEIKPNKDGIPTMILRAARKDEKLTTLDGKTHTLPGGDIVIEDGKGRLIDLCGIMGAENSSIKSSTKTVVLFMQTYDPVQIRKTQMALSHRSEAGSLFEKGLDSELVLPTVVKGVELIQELAGGKVASKLYDIYPKTYKPYEVSVSRQKFNSYMGVELTDKEIKDILTPLGFITTTTPLQITVIVPSFRRDIEIDVDIIEEIARIYGYHNLKNCLPDTEPPIVYQDPILKWEEEVKTRLRDWGFTETYTYSMISEELMDIFSLDKNKAYKISNPLSSEWVYMRPHLTPSVLLAIKQNLNLKPDLKIFELSNAYEYRIDDLPYEKPTLVIVWTGKKFLEAKGMTETIFGLFGIDFPHQVEKTPKSLAMYGDVYLSLGEFGSIGEINQNLLFKLGINQSITRLYLDFSKLVANAKPSQVYKPIPKYPPIIEDLSFILPEKTPIGDVMMDLKHFSPLIDQVELVNQYQNTSTFRIYYLDKTKPLTNQEVEHIRNSLIKTIEKKYRATVKQLSA